MSILERLGESVTIQNQWLPAPRTSGKRDFRGLDCVLPEFAAERWLGDALKDEPIIAFVNPRLAPKYIDPGEFCLLLSALF